MAMNTSHIQSIYTCQTFSPRPYIPKFIPVASLSHSGLLLSNLVAAISLGVTSLPLEKPYIFTQCLVQERSQWQEPDSVLWFCWSGESIWSCPPKGLVVGYEKGGGRRVDSASSTSYVQQCTQPSESWLWVQWGIWSWCWGTPGLCSQPSTLYHCAWGFI